MKKLLFLALLLTSCEVTTTEMEDFVANKAKTITYEGHEYLVFTDRIGYKGYGFMAHKGNCTACERPCK